MLVYTTWRKCCASDRSRVSSGLFNRAVFENIRKKAISSHCQGEYQGPINGLRSQRSWVRIPHCSVFKTVKLAYDDAVITEHAASQMKRRGVSPETVHKVLSNPEEILKVRDGRVVLQSIIEAGQYLLRVFVDIDRYPPEVVTAYRTGRVGKYRRQI